MMKTRKVPLRMCLGCREMKPKKELIRIVKPPEGDLAVDLTGRKAGRGAYICPKTDCLAKAVKQKQLERTFSCAVSDEVRQELSRAVSELEARAGL
ncbi:MAG: YlxR family protein [Clostridia bacterium]|nr:YlxR family protein [Clostridia bacterium]